MIENDATPIRLRLRRLIAGHPCLSYVALVFAIAWTAFLPPLLARGGLGIVPLDLRPEPFILLASVFGLTGSALLVTAATDGSDGLRALRRNIFHWRVGAGWYLLALFGMPLAALLGACLWLGPAPVQGLVQHWRLLLTTFLPGVAIPFVLVNLWEETGWTGFLVQRLQRRYAPWLASLLAAAPFALIHTPLFFIAGGLSDEKQPLAMFPLVLALLLMIAIVPRFISTWLFNRTGGSLPVVGLFHAVMNATTGPQLLPVLMPGLAQTWLRHTGNPWNTWAWVAGALGALIVVLATRGRLGYRRDNAVGSAPTHDLPLKVVWEH